MAPKKAPLTVVVQPDEHGYPAIGVPELIAETEPVNEGEPPGGTREPFKLKLEAPPLNAKVAESDMVVEAPNITPKVPLNVPGRVEPSEAVALVAPSKL